MKLTAILAAALAILTAPAMAATYFADPQGRFFITALASNAPLRFQVDTGADSVVLTPRAAAAAGITNNDIISSGSAQVASGQVLKTAIVRLRQMTIGRTSIPNAPATIILSNTADAGPNLLGMNILSRLGSIHISARTLTIDDGNATPQQSAARAQLVNTFYGQCHTYTNAICICASTLVASALSDEQLAFAVSHDWTNADFVRPSPEKAMIMEQARLALRYCGANPTR